MPNILAHSHVTAEVLGEAIPDVNLGSVIPDFAGMYRDSHDGRRVIVKGRSPELDRGIGFHYQTDRIFDRQSEVPEITTGLILHLKDRGLNSRTARLGATFLADVLIDGVLLDHDEPREAFKRLGSSILNGATALDSGKFSNGFADYVKGYFLDGVPSQK